MSAAVVSAAVAAVVSAAPVVAAAMVVAAAVVAAAVVVAGPVVAAAVVAVAAAVAAAVVVAGPVAPVGQGGGHGQEEGDDQENLRQLVMRHFDMYIGDVSRCPPSSMVRSTQAPRTNYRLTRTVSQPYLHCVG